MNKTPSIADFTNHHNFVIKDVFKDDEQAIIWLLAAKNAIETALASNANRLVAEGEPTWAMLRSMLDRVYEHASAAVICYFTGTWASMEVVVRASIEASATVIFVTQSDRSQRLGQYLAHYFVYTQKNLDRCEKSEGSDRARHDLAAREKIIRDLATHGGIILDATGWPAKVIDRFKAVGMEADYRNIYSVLSSQAHNDADALIDYIIVRCYSEAVPNAEALAANEMLFWMRFYFYSGLRYYLIAAKSFATAFKLSDAVTQLESIERDATKHLAHLSHEFSCLRNQKTA